MILSPEILKMLSAEFPPEQVNLKVQTKPGENGNALIVPYIDARDVIERLNSVVSGEWGDSYRSVGSGVECALTICGTTRCDIGNGDNENEPAKSGYSDSFKRAAVKFGIGLYLYRLPKVWAKVRAIGKSHAIASDEEERRVRAALFHPVNEKLDEVRLAGSATTGSVGNGHGVAGPATQFWTFVRANGISKQVAAQALEDKHGNFDDARKYLENEFVFKAA